MQIFSFSPPISLVEGKWLLGVSAFECTFPVFIITDENKSFAITIPGHWQTESAEKTIDELNKLLELGSQNSIELQVEQAGKKGLIQINDYSVTTLGTLKTRYLKN